MCEGRMRLWRGRTQDAQGGQSAEGRRLAEGTGPPGGAGTQEDWYWGASAGQSGGGLEEDLYWRRLSDSWYQKDLLPATYLEVHNQCYEAYNANPLANAIIELTTNFVLGSGIAVVASEPRAQAAIDRFWSDQDNHMATRVYSLCTELSLYGELFGRFFVNPYSGAVKIAQIDPSLIDQIETDPENIERRYASTSARSGLPGHSGAPRPRRAACCLRRRTGPGMHRACRAWIRRPPMGTRASGTRPAGMSCSSRSMR